MALSLPIDEEMGNIFPHSKEFDQGIGKERPGQATATVSLDGTGDFDSIQEAIDFLPSTGGVVYIKEGIYVLTSEVIINKSNITIQGSGKSTNISSSDTTTFTTETTGEISGIEISNLFFSGGGASILINFFNCSKSKVTSCWFDSADDSAIQMTDGSFEISVLGNFILGGYGIRIDGERCLVNGNLILSTTENAINILSGSTGTIVSNNIINSAGIDGIYIDDVSGIILSGNNITASGDNGIVIHDNSDRNIATGNICTGNTGYGIEINQRTVAADKNILIGNVAFNNTAGQINDVGTNTLPNGAQGTTNLTQDDLNMIT